MTKIGNYTVIRSIFNGPFSHVVEAVTDDNLSSQEEDHLHNAEENEVHPKAVALKVTIPCEDRAPHNSRDELMLLKQCAPTPYIVDVIDSFHYTCRSSGDLQQIIVMPLLPYDLNAVAKAHSKASYPPGSPRRNAMDLTLVRSVITDICRALAFLHDKSIIHRDIKPSNVMFASNGQDPQCRTMQAHLIDLGIAWHPDLDKSGIEPYNNKVCDVATASYRPPELLLAKRNYSEKIDMWAVGCIYAQLTSQDSSQGPFDPYTGDIALFNKHVQVLGSPSLESWPEMADNSTFTNMTFASASTTTEITLNRLCARAEQLDLKVIGQLLSFESTQRPSAMQVIETLSSATPTNIDKLI